MLRSVARIAWAKGLDAVTTADLRAASGLSSASLSNAFGTKAELLSRSVQQYASTTATLAAQAGDLDLPPREALRAALEASLGVQLDEQHPGGCLLAVAAASDTAAAGTAAGYRDVMRARLQAVVRRGVAEGALRDDVDAAAMSAAFSAYLHGMSIEARDGQDPAQLRASIDHMMAIWDAAAPRTP